jgi:phosphatidylglycerophosphate synthase
MASMSVRTRTSTAVLLAVAEDEAGGVACLLPAQGQTLLARLVGQLRSVGVQQVIVLTRPEWAAACAQATDADVEAHPSVPAMLDRLAQLAAAATTDLLIAHADLLTHDAAVADMVLDNRVRNVVLSRSGAASPLQCPPLRISEGRVVASGSAYHRCEHANARLLGMCKVGHADLDRAATVLGELAALVADPPAEWCHELEHKRAAVDERVTTTGGAVVEARSVAALRDDPLPLVVVGLVRRDVPITPVPLRGLYWARPRAVGGAATALEQLRSVDEDAVRLDAAVKDVDGFFTTFFVSPYSRYIARWAARRGLTPNQVTVASAVVGLLAAAAFAAGSRAGLVAGAILLQLAFVGDCVDGQLARYTRQFSAFGAWLDSVLDRAKEYAVYAGLAIGATVSAAGDASPADGIWLMATAALALQTFRHYVDFSHGAQRRMTPRPPIWQRLEAAGEAPVVTSGDHAVAAAAASTTHSRGRTAIDALVTFGRRPWVTWVKRIVVMPIGERFALISLTAAVWGPRATFTALLTWGAVAVTYTTAARILRPIQ